MVDRHRIDKIGFSLNISGKNEEHATIHISNDNLYIQANFGFWCLKGSELWTKEAWGQSD